jgi:cytochrome c oxidase assembly protein subunit 15
MSVPDWPNTYGYNMFAFPVSQWVGGIFYEHTHRLMASLLGLLTSVLAVWLWVRETQGRVRWQGVGVIVLVLGLMGVRRMPVYVALAALAPVAVGVSAWRIRRDRGALRWWGVIAFALVILQGVLGGLRVVLYKDQIGIFHAALAQIFFVLMCGLAWRVKRAEGRREGDQLSQVPQRFASLTVAVTGLIFLQLVLGATMRHQHAGLAIPDFPLAYGKLWPAMDPTSVALYNQHRLETTALNPITATQIGLQLAHRGLALAILIGVGTCAWMARRRLGARHRLRTLSLLWLGLILTQALLGAATIWTDKAADVATAHVLVGALSLALGSLLSLAANRSASSSLRSADFQSPAAQVPNLLVAENATPAGAFHALSSAARTPTR